MNALYMTTNEIRILAKSALLSYNKPYASRNLRI